MPSSFELRLASLYHFLLPACGDLPIAHPHSLRPLASSLPYFCHYCPKLMNDPCNTQSQGLLSFTDLPPSYLCGHILDLVVSNNVTTPKSPLPASHTLSTASCSFRLLRYSHSNSSLILLRLHRGVPPTFFITQNFAFFFHHHLHSPSL